MKPYGEKINKRNKTPRGDGCFLCTKERKVTKTANRNKAKLEAKRLMEELSTDKIKYSKKEYKDAAKKAANRK